MTPSILSYIQNRANQSQMLGSLPQVLPPMQPPSGTGGNTPSLFGGITSYQPNPNYVHTMGQGQNQQGQFGQHGPDQQGQYMDGNMGHPITLGGFPAQPPQFLGPPTMNPFGGSGGIDKLGPPSQGQLTDGPPTFVLPDAPFAPTSSPRPMNPFGQPPDSNPANPYPSDHAGAPPPLWGSYSPPGLMGGPDPHALGLMGGPGPTGILQRPMPPINPMQGQQQNGHYGFDSNQARHRPLGS